MPPNSNVPHVEDVSPSEKRTTERGLGVARATEPTPTTTTDGVATARSVGAAQRVTESGSPATETRIGESESMVSSASESQGHDFDSAALPVELVSSVTNEPRVWLIAPSSITVHVGRASEPPPPVQITYTSEPTRAIPYRAAIPVAIILFAAGAVVYSLLTRSNGHQRAATNSQPTVTEPRAREAVIPAAAPPPAVDAPAATNTAEPVILLDLPADDPQAPMPPEDVSVGSKRSEKHAPSTRRAQSRPQMRFQEPE